MTERTLAPETLTVERRYTIKDFTALRAYVQRIPPAVIARAYYDPHEDLHAATPGAMEPHLARSSTRWCSSRSRTAQPCLLTIDARPSASTANRS